MTSRHLLYETPDTNQILVPNDANLERLILIFWIPDIYPSTYPIGYLQRVPLEAIS